MFYVYVLKRGTKGDLYIGFTSNLQHRFAQHSARQNAKLLYYEAYATKTVARLRELQLKQYGGSWRSLKKRLKI